MLVSIIVNNYNYGRYVGAALDSALAQTWPALEVVVVDDGSTDDSWSVIEGYGARVRAVRQPNGGQGAAYNAGFAACSGEWVLFLDSDDVLDDDAVARMLALAAERDAKSARPGAGSDGNPDDGTDDGKVAKVQGYLRRVDADGTELGGLVPYHAHDGDVTPIAERFRQYGAPPSSGNLYRRSAIAPYFPLDAPTWRMGADTVPNLLCVFHGPVVTAPGAIGNYRLHTSANSRSGLLGNMDRSPGDALVQSDRRRLQVAEWGTRCTGLIWPENQPTLPWDWRLRTLSWRLSPASHPYAGDTRLGIWRGLNESLALWPGYTLVERSLQRVWVALMLVAPRPVVDALASSNVSGALRSRVRQLRKPRLRAGVIG